MLYLKRKDGKFTQSESNDIVPILNRFKRTSRFFIEWTKGVVGLTGYNGVLGYRTNELDSKDYSKRKEQAIKLQMQ